jgi:hypothetical protein
MMAPVRDVWWRALWVGPVRFGQKLLFPALVSGATSADFFQSTLPLLVFGALAALVVLQVRAQLGIAVDTRLHSRRRRCARQVYLRPFQADSDNGMWLCCLLALLYSAFASIVEGAATAPAERIGASVTTVKLLIIAYAAGRAAWIAWQRLRARRALTSGARGADEGPDPAGGDSYRVVDDGAPVLPLEEVLLPKGHASESELDHP